MAILVLGGAGYIGSHTVDRLVNTGSDVVVVDNLSTGHQSAVSEGARFYEGDVRDQEFMETVFNDEAIDAVIHFAAFSIVPESMKTPLKYFDNNVGGLITLLEVMKKHNVDKLIFSSSAATYGEPTRVPIEESDRQMPTNPYGESKLMMEKIMRWCDQAYGIKFVALRYFNVAGAKPDGSLGEDHHPETHLVPIILEVAAGKRDQLTIFGDDYDTDDGTCVRDYVHVEDLAMAHILAVSYLENGNPSRSFNLGSSTGFSNLQMLQAARKVTGQAIPMVMGPRRAGDPGTLVAASKEAREILNWQPEYDDVEKIIQTAWNWYQQHPNGYED